MGQFNFSSLEVLKAIISAAAKLRSPFIAGTSEGESRFLGGPKQVVSLVKVLKGKTGIPFFLNLDHGQSLDYIKEAVEAGYSSVHFDGSKLPLKENIALTKKVVQLARKRRVMVEGEVGVIGGDLTEPEEAEKFLRETRVDSLAVNVGTWHGKGKKTGIDFQRLADIKKIVKNVPLVLHGGSGVPPAHIRKAIRGGIAKININTELRTAFTAALKKQLAERPEEVTPYKYLPEAILAVERVVGEKIKLFGSRNRA